MTARDPQSPAGEPSVETKLALTEWIVRNRWDLAVNLAKILVQRGFDIDDPVDRSEGLRQAGDLLALEIAEMTGLRQ